MNLFCSRRILFIDWVVGNFAVIELLKREVVVFSATFVLCVSI